MHDCNISDIEEYGNKLKKDCNLLDVKKATWITTKNISSTQLLLTFKEKEPPRFIDMPGKKNKN